MYPPYDILTLVIDQLGSEHCYDELKACSQACRMLRHPCCIHIFSSVSIDKNAPRFAALLKENSGISKYVQELTYRPYIISEDLANAFLLLNNIRTLHIYGQDCNWRLLPPHIRHALTHLFSSPLMDRLYVHQVDEMPATLLSSCSTLKHLGLSECRVYPAEASDNILGAPCQLISLDLSNDFISDSDTVMEELPKMKRANGLPILDLSSLRSLMVNIYDDWQEKYFGNILCLAPKLDYLQCKGIYHHAFAIFSLPTFVLLVYYDMTPDSWVEKLRIVLPTLRSLKLTWDAYGTPTNLAFLGLIENLETLTSQPNCINELFLILLTNRSKNDLMQDLDWEGLDQVLADRSSFPRLEKLTIQLWSRARRGSKNLKADIQAKFEETKTTKFSRLFLSTDDYLDFKFEVHD